MATKTEAQSFITQEQVNAYANLRPLLAAMFREFQDATKKKPDGLLNKRKVEIVNRLLRDALTLLDAEPTRPYLDLADEDDLPQNSDVVLLLGQVVAAMEAFHTKYYRYTLGRGHHWTTIDKNGS